MGCVILRKYSISIFSHVIILIRYYFISLSLFTPTPPPPPPTSTLYMFPRIFLLLSLSSRSIISIYSSILFIYPHNLIYCSSWEYRSISVFVSCNMWYTCMVTHKGTADICKYPVTHGNSNRICRPCYQVNPILGQRIYCLHIWFLCHPDFYIESVYVLLLPFNGNCYVIASIPG